MQQHILIGRELVDQPHLGMLDADAVSWPVVQSLISAPLADQMRVAVDVYCVAVYHRHEYEEKTLRYDDGAGIIWFAGRCKNCGTITYVPQPKEPQRIVLPLESSLVQIDRSSR